MPLRAVAIVLALLLAAASGCGGEDAPSQPSGGVDRSFLAALIPQLQLAETISREAAGRTRGKVRAFARAAAEQRARELGRALEVQRRLGPGSDHSARLRDPAAVARDIDPQRLATARPAAPAYLQAMARLDEAVVRLAREELERGKVDDVKTLAGIIVEQRERERAQLR